MVVVAAAVVAVVAAALMVVAKVVDHCTLFCRIEGGVKKVFSPMASKLQETVVRTYEHMF